MQKGQTGSYITTSGAMERGKVLRVRGAHQVDIDGGDGAWLRQMVPIGDSPGCFRPDGFDHEHAPSPPVLARLVPRYIPTWHAVLLGIPVSAGTAALCELLWHWLKR